MTVIPNDLGSVVAVPDVSAVFGDVAVAGNPLLLVLAEGASVGSSMVTATDVRAVFDVEVWCGDGVFSVVGSDASLVVTGDAWLVLVTGNPWLVLVTDGVGVCSGGKVRTMSCEQGDLLPQITSARCTQSESGDRKNCKVNTDTVVLYGKHNLTKESQEVVMRLEAIFNGVFCSIA